MEKFNIGVFPFLILWGYAFVPSNSQLENMVCEKPTSAREGRKFTEPGPECDMSQRNWCSVKTNNYPEDFLLEYILDNRGIMKKLFGNPREARYLQEAFSNNIYDEPFIPPPNLKARRNKKQKTFQRNPSSIVNGRFPETEILANTRNEPTTQDDNNITMNPSNESGNLFTTVDEALEDQIELKKENEGITKTSTISLDFGDELRYDSKPISETGGNLFLTEGAVQVVNKFNDGEIPKNNIETIKETTTLATPSPTIPTLTSSTTLPPASTSDLLKGRVEFRRPSYSNPASPNTQKNPYVRTGYPVVQTYQATPSYENKVNPPKEIPQHQPSTPPANYYPTSQMNLGRLERAPACNSTSEFIAPAWARNTNGKNLVVVNVGGFMQELHIQECKKNVVHRKMRCGRCCRCEQEYRYQKLLVLDPDDKCRGIFSEWFRFPSSCDCVCFNCPMSRDARYMTEMDYDDDDYEDYSEDDLNDPAIRHYYSLDLLDNDENQNNFEEEEANNDDGNKFWDQNEEFEGDLETAPSQQRVYQSFTDISSIDRPLSNPNSLKNIIYRKEGSNLNFNDRLLNVIANNHKNSTPLSNAGREKKSRLLKGFNRTVNVRPQIPPRRFPPPRSSVRSYSFPWMNTPSLSIWPSIAMYKKFDSYNRVPLGRSYNGEANGIVTEVPFNGTTIGTLNAATPPYFDWKRKIGTKGISNDRNEKPATLSRIPRNIETFEQNPH